jgi:hypothetical protein
MSLIVILSLVSSSLLSSPNISILFANLRPVEIWTPRQSVVLLEPEFRRDVRKSRRNSTRTVRNEMRLDLRHPLIRSPPFPCYGATIRPRWSPPCAIWTARKSRSMSTTMRCSTHAFTERGSKCAVLVVRFSSSSALLCSCWTNRFWFHARNSFLRGRFSVSPFDFCDSVPGLGVAKLGESLFLG